MDKAPTNDILASQIQAKANYDRLSKVYDGLAVPFERKLIQAGLQLLAVQPGECVLEIGFGTGQALVSLARAVGAEGAVLGVDISEGMLAVAQKRVRQLGLAERVTLRCEDARALPFAATLVDAIFMSFTLELFESDQIPLVLQECRRVLKGEGDGRLGIVAMARRQNPNQITRFYRWLHNRFPAAIDCRPIDAQMHLLAAGFVIEAIRTDSLYGVPVDSYLVRK